MRHLTLLLFLLAGTCGRAQSDAPQSIGGRAQTTTPDSLQKDSIDYVINGAMATVVVYGQGTTSKDIAAPVATVFRDELRRYDQSSLLAGLNRLPGVRLEERTPGSYRVAIRGASLRSPFGVRNVQVYWNGIPFGEPGGDVPLNFLDNANVDRAEVIKGPHGGFYGPGTAGTLLLSTEDLTRRHFGRPDREVEASLTGGSFGYLRGDLTYQRNRADRAYAQTRLAYQRTDGHRAHTQFSRFTAQHTTDLGRARPGSRTKLHALYTKLDYELPGGLNADQLAADRTQARPGSADKNASIHYHNLLAGVTTSQQLGRWRADGIAYATGFYFDHPFNFDYKRETNLGGGYRLALRRRLLTPGLELSVAREQRLQFRMSQNFTNPDGTRPGDLNFADEIYSRQQTNVIRLQYDRGPWDATLSASSSRIDYAVDRTFTTEGDTGETDYRAEQPLNLRAAAGRYFGKHFLYLSVADGFSPPTLDEFRTNEGSLNAKLNPEVGVNYEIGYKYFTMGWGLAANVFHFALRDAIAGTLGPTDRFLFQNAGRTGQTGVELSVRKQLIRKPAQNLFLTAQANYTYYDFRYRDYERLAGAGRIERFDGNRIPGAAPHTVNAELRFQYRNFDAFVFHNYTDAIPLNDANDVFGRAYHLLRARLRYHFGRASVFVQGNNLLNDEHSFGNDLNARFGARYFQPAPGRNVQVGVRYATGK